METEVYNVEKLNENPKIFSKTSDFSKTPF